MNKWCLAAISGFVLLAAGMASALRPSADTVRASEIQALEFSVVAPSGQTIELHFTVRAETTDDAYTAAQAAAQVLIPGALVEQDSGRATAAYAFWPWKWAEELLPVPVAYNPTGAPANVSPDAIAAGIAPWNAVESSTFRINYTGLTDAAPGIHADVLDGQNVIGWLDLGCSGGCVLGVTTKSPTAYEVDIALNSNPSAGLGDGTGFSSDTTTVVLHEVGHLAGLEHSCQPLFDACSADEEAATMFPRYQGVARTLGADDIAGISALYPRHEDPVQGFPAPGNVQFVVDLQSGWNLMVLPPGPLDSSVGGLQCVDAVYTLEADEWLVWLRDGARALNSLTSVEDSHAYWVHSEAPCVQTFTITRFP